MHQLSSVRLKDDRWASSLQLRIKDGPDLFSETHRWISSFKGDPQMHQFPSAEDHRWTSSSVKLTDEPGLFSIAYRCTRFTVWNNSHQWRSLFFSEAQFFTETHRRTSSSVKLTEVICCPQSCSQTNLAFIWGYQMNQYTSVKLTYEPALHWDSLTNQAHKLTEGICFLNPVHRRT